MTNINLTIKEIINKATELASKGKFEKYQKFLNSKCTIKDKVKINYKIICPRCAGEEFKIIDKRASGSKIRRRRECTGCGKRVTTFEVLVAEDK